MNHKGNIKKVMNLRVSNADSASQMFSRVTLMCRKLSCVLTTKAEKTKTDYSLHSPEANVFAKSQLTYTEEALKELPCSLVFEDKVN